MRGTSFFSRRRLVVALVAGFVVAEGAAACSPEQRTFEGSGGAGGAGGGGTFCEPGTSSPCYSGPPSTADTGLCKSGTHECSSDGTSFSECSGEILPQPEDCATLADEACNGKDKLECPSLGHIWSKTFGDQNQQNLLGLAVDPTNGDIVFVGEFFGTVDFGGGPMASTGSDDGFIVRLDALGNHLWSKRFGDASGQSAAAVAIGPGGIIYVGGALSGSADFGDGKVVTSAGSDDAFVVKLDAGGNVLWSKVFGDSSSQSVTRLATTDAGQIVAGGTFSSMIDLGKGPIMSLGSQDVFVVKLDDAGFHVASRTFGGQGYDSLDALDVGPVGNVLISGSFEQTVLFGGEMLTSAGLGDVYVAELSPSLGFDTVKTFGDPSDQEAFDVKLAVNGDWLITGSTAGPIDLGAGPLTPPASAKGLYFARLDTGGTHVWSHLFGGPMTGELGARLAIDTTNAQIVIAGWFEDSIDFGGGSFVSKGFVDVFVARFGADGTHANSRAYGSPFPDGVLAVDVLQTGDSILGGVHFDTFDFGGDPLKITMAPDANVFVARLLP